MNVKKRGRKSKNEYYINKKIDVINTDDNPIILFLPISIEGINETYKTKSNISPIPIRPYDYDINRELGNCIKDSSIVIESIKQECLDGQYSLQILPKEITLNENIYKTNIACFWCCHTFKESPIFMPEHLSKGIYRVNGCFCSFNCCFAYTNDNQKYKKNIYLLNYMYKEITKEKGSISTNIIPSLPRETLKFFGGYLSIEEYRKNKQRHKLNPFPMIYTNNHIEMTPAKDTETKHVNLNTPVKVRKIKNNSLSKMIRFK